MTTLFQQICEPGQDRSLCLPDLLNDLYVHAFLIAFPAFRRYGYLFPTQTGNWSRHKLWAKNTIAGTEDHEWFRRLERAAFVPMIVNYEYAWLKLYP
jgi:hypothetical protein